MPSHEKKSCARCKTGFECKSGSILLCQCSKVELTAEQTEYVSVQYDDCLCLACLKDLQAEYNYFSRNKNTHNVILGWDKWDG